MGKDRKGERGEKREQRVVCEGEMQREAESPRERWIGEMKKRKKRKE